MGDVLTQVLAWDSAGPVAILLLWIVSIATGLLVPGWWVRKLIAEKDRQIAFLTTALVSVNGIGRAAESLIETVKTAAADRKDGEQG